MPLGASISEVEVRHHARVAGDSKYGISRTFKVLADLFTIQMLTRFRENPLRWFALLGSPFFVAAVLALLAVFFSSDSNVVMTAVAFLVSITFACCLVVGLLGEFVIVGSAENRSPPAAVREWRKGV
jgi:dolichol-phosphate mannosyltransferase